MTRLLVFGARAGSLGERVAEVADQAGMEVLTAGIANEDITVDYTKTNGQNSAFHIVREFQPDVLVCTVGMNDPKSIGESNEYFPSLMLHFKVNVEFPMKVVQAAIRNDCEAVAVVSSNSAHIPRSNSGPYCASKAALSMALRVAAREGAREGAWPLIYGYEFGLLADTPMTAATRASLPAGTPLSRMPGNEDGLDVQDAAVTILSGLLRPWPGMNGMLFRYDAGEL